MQDEQGKEKDGGSTDSGLNTSENLSRTASAEAVTSKFEKDKQYGGAEVIDAVNKILAADGRTQKDRADAAEQALKALRGEHEALKNQFTTVSDQVAQFLNKRDEDELAGVGDNKPLHDVVLGRQANRKEALRLQGIETEQKTRLSQLDERESSLSQREIKLNIIDAATKAGVDVAQLTALVPDGNPERLVKAANILKGSGQTNTQNKQELDEQGRVKVGADGKEIPVALRQKPASAISSGGDTRSISGMMLEKAKAKA